MMEEEWIDSSKKLPTEEGPYHVARAWDDKVKAYGMAWWDGENWRPKGMNHAAGPIIAWMRIILKLDQEE